MSEETVAPQQAETEAAGTLHPVLKAILECVPRVDGACLSEFRGMVEILLPDKARILDVCKFLKESPDWQFTMLLDIVSIDYWDEGPRFGLVYNIHSLKHNQRIFLKVRLPEDDPTVPTLSALWAGANWMEREAFDLMGIQFAGHPDLRKILTPDDLAGHPLRKDFPLGNVDVWPEGADTVVAR